MDAMLSAAAECCHIGGELYVTAQGREAATEHENAEVATYDAVIVIYSDDDYLSSAEHNEMLADCGNKYRAVPQPIDLQKFISTVYELCLHQQICPHSPHDDKPDKSDTPHTDINGFTYSNRTITYCGQSVRLTAREDELFKLMYSNMGRVVTRDMIVSEIWGKDSSTNVPDVYVSYLRRKLTSILGEGVLTSVRGEGYILKLEHI